ncbi:Lrp/AsnC family transcriptional regulator [Aestuariirhabdus sp. Z084]|uniref:Lrp/AsnC family transcriptional regulator n=1 Tax=Aestuariirhabdus haliotis TaxID=2918751 RepID=UPI00201B4390|nr:Lrp/AsnC family transcriptional regulator [Aestuariirhabdus haliotis]MCL6417067.1 Lrp/AsnC family transcriptional regulator [Aestuariirhabdus haliotis]MCL6420978.1 Lrp/AsnC family transcriptional regulator [Aestuariirhabdus haliotis]
MPNKPFDRIDRQILHEIQKNGNISNLELAERVGLSPSPCSRRVRLLQEAGIIDRQVTLLDQEALGLSLTIYINVNLGNQLSSRLDNFEARIAEYDEVLECALVTGSDADYFLKVVMPDMATYERFLLKELNQIEGVTSIRTSFVLRQVLQRTELPLSHIH